MGEEREVGAGGNDDRPHRGRIPKKIGEREVRSAQFRRQRGGGRLGPIDHEERRILLREGASDFPGHGGDPDQGDREGSRGGSGSNQANGDLGQRQPAPSQPGLLPDPGRNP